jgi:peptidoglycan hydrolase-like protein with peptidoglycan-binding domain
MEKHMNSMSKTIRLRAILTLLIAMTLGVCLVPRAAALDHDGTQKLQQTLHDKGFYNGPVDGIMGHQTREAIRQYQKSEDMTVTGHLDGKTADKLGVEPETVGGEFKASGEAVGTGGKGVGHEMKEGKPIAAGKDLGEGVGKGGKDVGKGVKNAVDPKSDSTDPEKKQ